MKKNILFIILLLISVSGFAQNLQNNNWIIDNTVPGVNFGAANVSTFPFPSIPTSSPSTSTPSYLEGSATLSDQSGNLLLFSDGKRLWRNNPGTTATLITTGLLGDSSSTQNVIFIPKPGNPNRYYVVTINGNTSTQLGLYYSEVDLVTNSMILPLNRVLSTGTFFDANFNQIASSTINSSFLNDSQSITSTKHSNGKDYWLIAHVQNNVRGIMLSFRVSCNGIQSNTAQVAQELTLENTGSNIAHSVKISPNGSRIALTSNNGIFIGGFNSTSGAITFNNYLDYNNSDFSGGYGVEFSPDSNVLFYSNGNGVIARDLVLNTFTYVMNSNFTEIGLQLARDGRIYFTNGGGLLSVINNPNTINNLQVATTAINGSSIFGLPQWVHQQVESNSTIIAQNDIININSCVASSISVLQNNSNGTDMLNGNTLINLSGNATLSIVGSITPIPLQGSIVLNPTNGLLTVAAGTSPGTYSLRYKLCTLGTCPTCSNEAVVTINITSSQNIVPTFNLPSSICSGSVAPVLETTSTNLITGTWSPSVVSNTTSGSYTFTPTAGLCASVVTVNITVNSIVTPIFNLPTSICSGSVAPILPTTSLNGISGTWSPPVVSNTTSGPIIFNPDPIFCASVVTITITVEPIVTPTFNLPSSICRGSVAPTLPNTSLNNITGTWSPSVVSNTSTANYTFTPSAGSCATTIVKRITVIRPSTPSFTLPSTICSGSVAPVLPTTSTNGIAGTWSPSVVSNTVSGDYTFIPLGMCVNSVVHTITVTPSVEPIFNIPTSICSGSVAPILPTTSLNGITGTWSPSVVSNTTSGIVTFTPTAGLCANVVVVSITVNDIVTPVFNINTLICNGCTAPILPATSINGITGTWSPSVVSNTTSNDYVFTPNNGQCATSTSIHISIAASLPTQTCFGFDPPSGQPDITNEGQLNYGYLGAPYSTPISATGLTFTWYFKFEQGELLTFDVQNPTFRELCPTNPVKSFAVVVSNGLQSKTYASIDSAYLIPGISTLNITKTCFIHSECSNGGLFKSSSPTIKEVKVYPNPTNSIIKFEGENLNNCKVSIYNNIGNEVIKEAKANEIINLEKLQNGIYLYRLIDQNGLEQIGKIIKE